MTPFLWLIAGLLAVLCIFAGLLLWMLVSIARINRCPDDDAYQAWMRGLDE